MAAGEPVDDSRWLASTPLLDLTDPKISLKARSLTQLVHGERPKVLTLYAFAKKIPFAMPFKLGAREVLQAGQGDRSRRRSGSCASTPGAADGAVPAKAWPTERRPPCAPRFRQARWSSPDSITRAPELPGTWPRSARATASTPTER